MFAMRHDGEVELPPLPAWPAEVMVHEPAHGLFKRIAVANGQISTRALAAHVGLNGRYVNPEEMLEFCRRFPIRHLERLEAATPKFDGNRVTICGQVFRRADWSIAQPRVCAGCLTESRHHRTWFDLTLLSRCPIHGEPLVDAANGARLANWFPEVGIAPTGEIVQPSGAARPDRDDRSLERFILGRMGIINGFELPWLAGFEVHEVVEAADLLGAACGFRASRSAKLTEVRRQNVHSGFAVLSAGEGAVESQMSRALHPGASAPEFSGPTRKMRWWFNYRLAQLSNQDLASQMRTVFRRVSSRQGVLPRRWNAYHANDVVPLSVAAAELGLSKDSAMRLASDLGLIRRRISRGFAYAVTPKDRAAMRQVLDSVVSRERAAGMLGLSGPRFTELCRRTGIRPVVRLFGSDHFRRDEVIKSIAAPVDTRGKRSIVRPVVGSAALAQVGEPAL
jgi:hypothetical protein